MTPPLRLVIVGGVAQPWGAEIALLRLLDALAGAALVHVVLLEDGPMVERYRATGAAVTVLPIGAQAIGAQRQLGGGTLRAVTAHLGALVRLRRLLSRERPDVVVGNTLRGSALAGPAARLAGRPFCWMARDRLSPDYVSGVSRHVFRMLLRTTASIVVANSRTTAATLPSRPAPVVLHDPLPAAMLAAAPARAEVLTVGIVGRLAAWKGHRLFLEAFADAFPHGDTRARVVGASSGSDAVDVQDLRRLAHHLGVAGRVDFIGHTDDVRAEYDRMDVVVHASVIPEPFGQVVAEALARGCVVVGPDIGGPAELLEHRHNGLTYAMGSREALVAALREVGRSSAEDRRRWSTRGRETAHQLAPAPIAAEFLSLLATAGRTQR